MFKKVVFSCFFLIFSFFAVFSASAQKSNANLTSVERANLKQGADAYKNEDWQNAIFFLRKVVTSKGGANDENYFMLIKSEIYAGEYRQAQNDCEKFLTQFNFSPYSEYVQYQNGRLLHLLSRNEDAVLALSDFCHEHTDSELYPLALFWIAESFYDEYNFEAARGLYERVVNDFPGCEKAPQAQYKLDLIERRVREEKLLYLLKVIGEENLSTREEYERQLRIYALEDDKGIKKALIEAEARIAELEALLEEGGVPVEETEIVIEEPKIEEKTVPAEVQPEVTKTEEPKPEETKPATTEETVKAEPKKTAPVNVIQNVNESSIRVKKNSNGRGTSAPKSSSGSNSNADVQALKRKAKQLQYLLDEQAEEDSK